MNNAERTMLAFLAGLGIGAGVALLFAPRSGEETRAWIADTTEREFRKLRRNSRRSVKHLRNTLAEGEDKVADILKDGKEAVALMATKLF